MKVLLAVMSCVEHQDRHKVIQDTWGRDVPPGVNLEFFIGPRLGVPDDYANLYKKTQAICRWAAERGYDYLARIDTDTYVHVPRLFASDFDQWDYSGYVRPEFKPLYCYGPCYWLSRKAFTIVGNADWLEICRKRGWSIPPWDYEDVMAGVVLEPFGILPHHDERYSHWFPVTPCNDKIIHHLGSIGGYTPERMYASHRLAYP